MTHGRIIAAVAAALSTAALWPAGAAADDVLVVTRTNDLNGACVSGAACSLREAIALANSDPDNDIVVVPPGDYTLDLPFAGQLAVTAPVTIVGTGTPRNTSVRGAGSRVLKTSADTVLAGFTVRDGNGKDGGLPLPGAVNDRGGGIWQAAGKLTLANMRVTANQVDNPTATGGGIQHEGAGTLTIAATLIDSNLAKGGTAAGQLGRGGGILAAGSGAVTIASSTLTGSGVQGAAGSQGGGLATDAASSVALVNATLAANTATGAGTLGGNVAPGGPVSARNTIVSGGTAPAGANCSGPLSSQGNNLELGSGCGLERNADPGLGALADNGGPTDTLAITSASPAFDAGTDAGCPAIDQRGQARPQGRVCDIGAFEVVAPRPPPSGGGAGGGSGAGGSGGPSADTRAPVLASLAVAPFAFRSAPSGPSVRAAARRAAPVGAVVSHTLSEAATVAYVVERSLPHNRWAAMTGAFARRGARGVNRFRFTGRLSGKRLAPGRYRLLTIARDAAGNVSRLARREFRIVP